MARARLLPPLLLAVPFLAGVIATQGLTHGVVTFHSTDELAYHVPTIRLFADALPGLHLGSYPAAQTPLFHLVMAVPTWIFGLHLALLRALNVLIAYAAALVLFRLLRRRLGLAPWAAFAVTGLWELSPYVYGASFLLLTDALAWLLALLALDRLLALRRLPDLAVACVWIALTLLTRQSYVWLLPLAAVAAARALPRERWAPALGLIAAAAVPLAVLVAVWGSLVPPGSDAASCGLCEPGRGPGEAGGLSLRPALFTIALAGVYGAGLFGPRLLARRREETFPLRRALLGLAIAAVLLLAFPLAAQSHDAGYLWQVSRHLPEVLGSSLVFWGLVPLGGAVVAVRWARPGRAGMLAVAAFAFFLLSTVATRLVYQKYFDPFALLGLALTLRAGELERPWENAGIAVLAAASVAYALSF
jgi:hypothetical protein